jgi:uncharacterized PurR-regulated membrane protein YhhQ (DUF165 family)
MKFLKFCTLAIYLATIPAANWFINNVGTQLFPGGPHTIPVGFGYAAPSGVLLIGIALFTRDFIQEEFGKRVTLGAIVLGIGLSYLVNPAVATASAVAFAVSEMMDFAVYSKIKKRTLTGAVVFSGVTGGIADSFLFLYIAFGSINYWQGQVIGKTWMALLGGLLIWGFSAVSNGMHTKETSPATTAS